MAIPEFILKKLVVPGSFQSTNKGFSFKIVNSFAPASISRFEILVGDQKVPPAEVLIDSTGKTPIHGSEITPTNPMPFPVNLQISVTVNVAPRHQQIRVIAMTKEVGEVAFTLSDDAPKKKPKKLKPSYISYLKPVKHASVQFDPAEQRSEASPFLLGQFVEHLERCVYDGIWTRDGKKIRPDTLDLIKQLHPPIIRYPGGNFASGYHWEDGIGPRESRPSRHDAAWQAEESNQVGTDEFLAFCHEIGTEPLLVVNDGSGTPEEAARWVEYCNGMVDTPMGALRAKNGHPEPYHVRYWGVGNEVWGPWQIGTTTAEEYSRRAFRFIDAMKAVDPLIKIIAVGNNPLTDALDDPASLWNRHVLESIGNKIDYLSWHIYQPEKSGWQDEYDPQELFKSVCAAHIDMEGIIRRVESQITQSELSRPVLQAVDEWNLWFPPREKNVSMHNVTYTMRDALYVASVLSSFFKQSRTVGMANLAQLVNVLPLIQTNAQSAIATAIFYPFILFAQMKPWVVHPVIECETFSSRALDINVLAHEYVPYLDSVAGTNEDGSVLTLVLVNRYPVNRLKVALDLGTDGYTPKNALSLSAVSPEAFNSFSNPYMVRLSVAKKPVKKGNLFQVSLKPCSVYFVELTK